jgi:hypothetical protein
MQFPSEMNCRKCERPMRRVAAIAPIGQHSPGLVAFQCEHCGAISSDLVRQPPPTQNRGP